MSTLLIDLGNSRAKLAVFDGGMRYLGDVGHGRDPDFDLPARVGEVWLASVLDEDRTSACLSGLGLSGAIQHRVRVEDHLPLLPTRYASGQLGVDRWLGALAAYRRVRRACVVVDAGTATTIDLVDGTGVHLGGYILPGPAAMREAVLERTAIRLPDNAPDCADIPPRRTRDAIHCGALAAQCALIRECLERLGADAALVLGGGAGREVNSMLGGQGIVTEQLVLAGLAEVAAGERTCAG